ncbi:DUF748 domain-containing protein [Stutzerimonas azotifigens]|uniref:DUF748 domain-containing protein n=1 Tax=Stutzerimonas azotifigens TaxID=291995 RepID=A0ABR5Z387_9GAMM|nr:DUF748 domain-containing protein [Stutzerimonas azotifigens]MBA1274620.1 DUF748 domain-containing protein [Stutzerimonas azotifigens]
MKNSVRIPLIALLVIAFLLLALHLALPYLVRNLLNDKMADMGDYRGHVEDVDLAWWRGAYQINDLVISKADDSVQVPLLRVPVIDLAVSWRALWEERAIVAVVRLQEPELNFVDSESESEKQTGEGVDWRDTLQELLLVRLDEVQIENGTLAFRNFSSDPQVNLYADQVNLTINNLTNERDTEGSRDASLKGTARFLDHAPMEVEAYFDPLVRMEDFDFRLRVTGTDLTRLNDFASAYGRFDFKGGTGDLVVEVEARNSQLDGYIKPLLHNVDVFDWEQDVKNDDEGFLRGLWEAVVGGGQNVLQNQEKDQFATRIEVSGNIADTDVSPLQAFFAILRNAFVEAFAPRFERALGEDE